ncbi:SusC/RagA family TonB-linked outer membrane protein [Pedobacter caeni]|uniref:TonB-linked outer membrane protein, SusC/RagA family n=1 Tax=Pedobacter caeni TaxID=288992 RepID=A0A1M5PNK5_9SPHI|nr:SusC/RagA family TonB-linked outer membrane protein [Pedobacter caeni]SHH03372.1 TonB-linked outer membrane protein, SusC/RagA family [Pedobacter caeni]
MKAYLFLLLTFCGYLSAKGQININGTVQSAKDKSPLRQVSVKIKGSNNTIHTDHLGNFNIKHNGNSMLLEISHVGYQSQEIVVLSNLKNRLIILLKEDVQDLKEVMISTGYQQLPKERATGSFTIIDQKTLNQQMGPNILDRLEGVASSVLADRNTSGSNGRLMIRGLSTIQGPREPLIVLDNFPYEGELNNINPNDVANITILKDAAAASIWGARAGNGVIVITTKRGRFNQKLNIDFNINHTIGNKPDLSYLPQIASSDFVDVETMLYNKGYYKDDINSPFQPALSPIVELLIKRSASSPSEQERIDEQINALKGTDVRDDFNRYFYRRSLHQQYAINLSGGSESMNWLVSSGYDRSISHLDAPSKRLNFRVQNTVKLSKHLELSTAMTYTKNQLENGRPAYGEITGHKNSLAPYVRFADADGASLALSKAWKASHVLETGKGKLLDWQYYPLEDYKHNKSRNNQHSLIANVDINQKLPLGLSANVKYQYQRQQNTNQILNDEESYFSRNLVNSFSQISKAGELTYKVPPGGILQLQNLLIQSNSLRGQLNLDRDWKNHKITAIAGVDFRETVNTGNMNRLYGYDEENITNGLVDHTQEHPHFITGSKSFIPSVTGISDQNSSLISLFTNAAYTFKDKYSISLSARKDASNLFGLHTNDKWNPLWSSGLAWEVSKESFYKSAILPYLNLRLTYGFNGNVDVGKSAVTTIEYFDTSPYTLMPMSRFNKYANPELKWETSRTINIGLDFSMMTNRISGSIEYYLKKGTDLFGTSLLDYTGGVGSSIIKNVASTKGSGVDLALNSKNIDGTFKWSTNLNFSINKDEITKYYLKNRQGSNFLNNGISGIEGKPTYSIFAYKWAGLDPQTGEPRGYLNNEISKAYNKITSAGTQIEDLRYYGSAVPTVFGSMGNTFSYRNLSLTFRLIYKFGYYFRRNSIDYPALYAQGRGHSDFSKRWKQSGDEDFTTVPANLYPFSNQMQALYTFSEALVERGDHIRLHYINLNYELNKDNFKRIPFKSLNLYFNINNPGILWRANKENIDPDYYGERTMPLPRSYSFGVRANF